MHNRTLNEIVLHSKKNLRTLPLVTLAANTSAISEKMKYILENAKEMFHAKAFTHWYYRYGFTESTFTEAFERVESIISSYEMLKRF